jgi:hypothetical protein
VIRPGVLKASTANSRVPSDSRSWVFSMDSVFGCDCGVSVLRV